MSQCGACHGESQSLVSCSLFYSPLFRGEHGLRWLGETLGVGKEQLAIGVCPPNREDRTQAQGKEGGVEKIEMRGCLTFLEWQS